MKYNIIMLDADETLFDFRRSEKEALEGTLNQYGVEYEEEYHLKVYGEINDVLWKELERGLISQKDLNAERFRRFLEVLGVKVDEEAFAADYLLNLSRLGFLLEDSEKLVKTLAENYRLAVVTNGFKIVQEGRMENSPIKDYIEALVISEVVGFSKPDPRMFDYALDKLNFNDRTKVLMVGDSLTSDIKGGINAGIDTCWYNPDKVENKSDIKPVYEINSLMELIELLGRQ